jgi:hypothetical protein
MTKGGRYRVVIALVEADVVVDVRDLVAPRGEDESDALAELRVRVRDVLRDRGVETLALWHVEGSHRGVKVATVRPSLRAEGVVLAAAGEAGARVVEVAPSSQRKSLAAKSNDEAADKLASTLSGQWPPDALRSVAAVAAMAAA